MQLIGTDDDGNIVVLFDSRWKFPELLGYEPGSKGYVALQELWTKVVSATTVTGKQVGPQPGPQVQKENGQ